MIVPSDALNVPMTVAPFKIFVPEVFIVPTTLSGIEISSVASLFAVICAFNVPPFQSASPSASISVPAPSI